jgi:hypothetical protein
MKKSLILFFAFTYLISISGIAISNFYCCGKFKESYLFQTKILAKECKNKIAGPSCCDTHTKLIKVKDDHTSVDSFTIQAKSSDLYSVASNLSVETTGNNINNFFPLLFDIPPLICKLPAYISQCVFRI